MSDQYKDYLKKTRDTLKTLAVINSCETIPQLESGYKYLELYKNKYQMSYSDPIIVEFAKLLNSKIKYTNIWEQYKKG